MCREGRRPRHAGGELETHIRPGAQWDIRGSRRAGAVGLQPGIVVLREVDVDVDIDGARLRATDLERVGMRARHDGIRVVRQRGVDTGEGGAQGGMDAG
jgi:hypothetical protein